MEIPTMAKTHTPTIKEITEKLKKMGFHKINGKPKMPMTQYPEATKSTPDVKELKSSYITKRKK